jgi:hypothetical protein
MTFDSSGIRIMSNDTIIHDESTRLPDNKSVAGDASGLLV